MPYANLIAQGSINPQETFQRFRDFLCKRNGTYDYSTTGIGWTLYDAVYAVDEDNLTHTDYIVVYSAGEDGLRDMYFKIIYDTAYWDLFGYLSWDSGTHTGVEEYGATNGWYNPDATNNILWVYGDLDAFIGISKYGADYETGLGGWMPDSPISQDITTAAASITAGSSVVVSFSTVPAEWAVGTYLFVRDTSNIERVQITNISGTDVTFATFVNSYAAGSKFCMEITNYIKTYRDVDYSFSYTFQIDHAGNKNTNGPAVVSWNVADPVNGDAFQSGKLPATRIYFADDDNFIGPLKNLYGTISLTSETSHTLNGEGMRYFGLYGGADTLVKEV